MSTSPEQRFYLEHFRDRTVVIADPGGHGAARAVDACVDRLLAHGTRIVVLQPATPGAATWRGGDDEVVVLWRALRTRGQSLIRVDPAAPVHATGATVATRLRAHRLVLLDPTLPEQRHAPVPYATLAHDVEDGAGGVPALAAQALAAGVDGVNVCRPEDLTQELLTYRGAGTLYTHDDYCTVERLGIDGFDQVQRLIEQGVLDGYLKPRDDDEIARLLVNGYGAVVGEHHLAGFAALLTEPYAGTGLGELCAVTTISRFAGEGVGGQLVRRIVADARPRGLDGVFACTTSDAAATFFTRLGFVPLPLADVPAAKWDGYDAGRRARVRALLATSG